MKNILVAIFALIILNSCSKKGENTSDITTVSKPKSNEVNQVQEPLVLQNEKGETITVTYFAEGDVVAVKLKKEGESEQKLSAKTSRPNGNPLFTNENFMWEMTQEGKGGKLSGQDGNAVEYK